MQRTCSYRSSKGVDSVIGASTIEEMIKRSVDEAYEKNLTLANTYVKRFQLWTLGGKVVNDNELFDSILNRPKDIGYLLPVVCVFENKGNNTALIFLHTEILENSDFMKFPEMYNLAKKPPNVTVEDLILSAQQKKIIRV